MHVGLLTETTRVGKDDLALLLGGWGHIETTKTYTLVSACSLRRARARRANKAGRVDKGQTSKEE